MNEHMNQYTTEYEWTFPHLPRVLPDERLSFTYEITLAVPHLAEDEQVQVLERFYQRLSWLTQEVQDLARVKITDQCLWRCYALAYVQVQHTLFSLEHVGFLLLSHGVEVRKDLVQLHGLLQTFATMPALPGFEAYDQLPDCVAHPEDEPLNLALSVSDQTKEKMSGWQAISSQEHAEEGTDHD